MEKTISDQELLKIDPLFHHHINPFIYSGYRIPTFDYQKCLQTILYLHNETVNIWSHLIGFFIFIGILIKWTYDYYQKANCIERFAVYFYIINVMILLSASCAYHTFNSHSVKIADECLCYDWMAVSLVCACSAVYSGYYLIYQQSHAIYFIFLIILISFMIFFSFLSKESLKDCHEDEICPEENHQSVILRTLLYCLFSSATLISWIIHYFLLNLPKWNELKDESKNALWGIIATYMAYGTVIFKIFAIPEQFSTYTFDLFGYSHQIFHFGIVSGALILWNTFQSINLKKVFD